MAGYTLSPNCSPNSSQTKRKGFPRNGYQTSSPALRRSSHYSPNDSTMNNHHPYSSPRVSSGKIVKTKDRIRNTPTFKQTQRKEYMENFLGPSFRTNPKMKPPIHLASSTSNAAFNIKPPSMFNRTNNFQSYESTPMAPAHPGAPHFAGGQSFNLVNLIKCKGLSAISPIKIPPQPIINGFTTHESMKHDFETQRRLASSPPPPTIEKKESKLSKIEKWSLPEKSNIFKNTIKHDILYPSKDENVVQRNVASLQDSQLVAKLNSLDVYKSDRKTICSSIKSFFTSSFSSFNFRDKIRKFIPFGHDDYEVSDEALVEREEETPLVPWTDEMEQEITTLLRSPNRHIRTAFSINIHTNDLKTLCGTNWLNDAVIEFYINLIVERSKTNPRYPSVYAFNTFFFTRLSQGQTLGRWAKKLDFFSYDILLVPIHAGAHWRLAIVDNVEKRIVYYDSLGNEFPVCVDALAGFLQQESLQKRQQPLDMTQWQLVYLEPGLPLQNNGYDCGVFTCKYAEYIARRARISFTQDDIPYFRRCMIYEIVHQELLVH